MSVESPCSAVSIWWHSKSRGNALSLSRARCGLAVCHFVSQSLAPSLFVTLSLTVSSGSWCSRYRRYAILLIRAYQLETLTTWLSIGPVVASPPVAFLSLCPVILLIGGLIAGLQCQWHCVWAGGRACARSRQQADESGPFFYLPLAVAAIECIPTAVWLFCGFPNGVISPIHCCLL